MTLSFRTACGLLIAPLLPLGALAANLLLISDTGSPNYAANDGALVLRAQLLGHAVTVVAPT
jgi:hypothetical protein